MIRLKLWERLKQLRLNKKYLVRLKKEDFIKNKVRNVENVKLEDEEVVFVTNDLYEEGINRYMSFFNKIFKSHFLIIFSIVIIFLLLFASNYYIREIVFEDELTYSESVYNEVKNNLNKIGNVYVLNDSLNELNNKIQRKFYNYSYIGLVRKTGKLIIVIKLLPNYDKVEEENDERGNLISLYNAYVVGLKLKKGVSLVVPSQVVRKGDVLITGNLKHHLNNNELNNYIHPSGAVFGKVIEYEEVVVKKVNSINVLNGNVKKFYLLEINNKLLGKNKVYYNKYENKEKCLFDLFSILMFYRVYQYEKEDIVIEHSNQTSFSYAVSEIERRFISRKKYEEEKLLSIDLIKSEYINGEYRYLFCVKKVINIVKFESIEEK